MLRLRQAWRALTSPLALLLTLGILAYSPTANAVPKFIKKLIFWETEANSGQKAIAPTKKSADAFPIEHWEIPAEMVSGRISEPFTANVESSLYFERDGKRYFRWLIYPEDETYNALLEAYFKKNGVKLSRSHHFIGHYTASRSLVLRDPKTEYVFSAKASTDIVNGRRSGVDDASKRLSASEALTTLRMSEYVRDAGKGLQHSLFMQEPAAFGIPGLNQGIILRSFDDLAPSNYYLPAFSALSEKVGKEIATLNGATDIAAFWEKNLNQAFARASAELYVKTGLTLDSPHGQNILIELDADYKPTGRIIFRDITDTFMQQQILAARGKEELAFLWTRHLESSHHKVGTWLDRNFGTHSWLSEKQLIAWRRSFFETYEAELSKATGIPITELAVRGETRSYNQYDTDTQGWRGFFKKLSSDHCVTNNIERLTNQP